MSQTKASDVIELGIARALLGCSSSMSLLDGVRSIKAELTDALVHIEHLEAQLARKADDKGSGSGSSGSGEGNRPQEP